MKEHGIAFSPAMLEAIRAGRKTQTRRIRPRKIEVGDRIWVKEKLQKSVTGEVQYAIDGLIAEKAFTIVRQSHEIPISGSMNWQWTYEMLPAMFMPKWAARTWLEVTGVRMERLQDISDIDLLCEGIDYEYIGSDQHTLRRSMYQTLWDSLHTKTGERWQDNPLVQVIEFKVAAG